MNKQLSSIISFSINSETFALDALRVRNILEVGEITWVPNTKDYILGVINLHGNIIPVADGRKMLGIEEKLDSRERAIIVVSDDDKNESLIGIVVDGVKEVFEVAMDEIEESIINNNVGLVHTFTGSYRSGDEFVHIIDLNELVQEFEK